MSDNSFDGSQAFNRISNAIEDVIPNSGSLMLNVPIVDLIGLGSDMGLKINLCYSLGTTGTLGLPTNWSFGIPSLVPGESLSIKGSRYIVDPNWMDATGYASGLKYENNHGVAFVDNVISQPLPYGQYGVEYEFTYSDTDGSVCYFDSTGTLLMKADRYGNYIYYAYTPDPQGNLLAYIVDSYGQTTTFTYNPGQIVVALPDSRQVTINCDTSAVYSVVDQIGNTTTFTNSVQGGFSVVSTISYPTGKTTNIDYTSIGFLDSAGSSYSIPAVSDLNFLDPDNNFLAHYQYTYGTQSNGNTFTGMSGGYTLASDSDGLLESNNTAYVYDVEVRTLNESGVILSLTNIFYSFAHVPITQNTYVIDNSGVQGGFLQVNSVYDISQDAHNQQPNYLSPKQTQQLFFPSPSAPGIQKTQISFQYDDFGNSTYKQTSFYDNVSQAYVASMTETASYFTQGSITTLLSTATKADNITNQVVQTVNSLTADARNIASSTMNYSGDGGTTWIGWKASGQAFDANGRVISATLQWVESGMPGVQQTSSSCAYTYDSTSFTVTNTITDVLGFNSTQVISTMYGHKLSETNPSGKTTTYAYDQLGRLLSKTSPSGRQTTHTYKTYATDGENSTSTTTALGYLKKTVHDPLGRKIATYDNGNPGNAQQLRLLSQMQYDVLGNVISETDVFGNITTGSYNSLGKPTQSVDPLNNQTVISYDLGANATTTSINDITLKKVVTDNFGQPIQEEMHPNTLNSDQPSQYTLCRSSTYDGFGNLLSRVSSQIVAGVPTQLHSRTYQYNAEFQRIGETFTGADGSVRSTKTVYDLNKKEVSHTKTVTYKNGATYTVPSDLCQYDALGQMVSLTNKAGQVESYTYNSDRHLESKTLFDGSVISYTYSSDGKKTQESWTENGNARSISYTYDHGGHLLSTSDASGTVTNTYTLDGVLTSITYPDGKGLVYTLDQFSRKVSQLDASGATTTYSYTAQNQLLEVTTAQDSLQYGYYDDTSVNVMRGTPKSVSLANKYTETYQYDAHGRKNGTNRLSVSGVVLFKESSVFNALNKVTYNSSSSALTSASTVNCQRTYSYDAFGQLTAETVTNNSAQISAETFQYDGNGNVIQKANSVAGTSTSYTYNDIDQLTAYTPSGSSQKTQVYDTNGRLIVDGAGNSYAYDALGRLLGVKGKNGTTQYAYYPNDLLATRTSQASAVRMYYDNLQQVINTSQNGTLTAFLMVGSNRFASYCGSSSPYYFGTNQRNDTVLGYNAAQGGGTSLIGSASYEAYGAQSDISIGMDASNNFAWNQEYTDVNNNLVYLRARYYDPATMRFISRDSKRLDNRYSFGNGDPVNHADPTGHDVATYVELGAGAVIGVGIVATIAYMAVTYGTAAVAVATTVTAAAGGVGVMAGIGGGAIAGAGMLMLGAGAGVAGPIAGGVALAAAASAAGFSASAVGAAVGTGLGLAAGTALGGPAVAFGAAAAGGIVGGVIGTSAGAAASAAAGYVGSAVGAAAGYASTAAGYAGAAVSTAAGYVSSAAGAAAGYAGAAVESATAVTEAASAAISAATTMAADAAAAAAAAVGADGAVAAVAALLPLLFL